MNSGPERVDRNGAPPFYLVVDLEATCSEDRVVVLRHEMEIIEIGAVMVRGESLEPVDEFQSFVRPVRNPVLTDFCIRLTGITQCDVDGAQGYRDVAARFAQWLSAFPGSQFCSWGDYDRRQFERDCEYHGIEYPFESGHLNIKAAHAKKRGMRRGHGLDKVLAAEGIPFEGRHHRGIDDARNIAKLLPLIVGDA